MRKEQSLVLAQKVTSCGCVMFNICSKRMWFNMLVEEVNKPTEGTYNPLMPLKLLYPFHSLTSIDLWPLKMSLRLSGNEFCVNDWY